jgi:hypothetical protein
MILRASGSGGRVVIRRSFALTPGVDSGGVGPTVGRIVGCRIGNAQGEPERPRRTLVEDRSPLGGPGASATYALTIGSTKTYVLSI